MAAAAAQVSQTQGVLRTLQGNVVDLRANTDRRIDRLYEELLGDSNRQFGAVNGRIDTLEGLLATLQERTAALQTSITALDRRMPPLGNRLDTLDQQITDLRRDLAQLLARLNQGLQTIRDQLPPLEARLNSLLTPLSTLVEERLTVPYLTGAFNPRLNELQDFVAATVTATVTAAAQPLNQQLNTLATRLADTDSNVDAINRDVAAATAAALSRSDLDRQSNAQARQFDNLAERCNASLAEIQQLRADLLPRRPRREKPKVKIYCVVM